MRFVAGVLCGLFLIGAAPVARGAGSVAQVPASRGQLALAVGVDGADLVFSTCPRAPCALDKPLRIPVAEEARANSGKASLRIVRVGSEGRALVATVPGREPSRAFEAVIVAGPEGAPRVVFSGMTGYIDGEEGERGGARVEARDGTVYVGEQREHRTLCGRPLLLAPKALDPATLTLKPAKLQRLTEQEREQAPRLTAARSAGRAPAPGVLVPVWATSAAAGRLPGAVADGNPDTLWSEGRGGEGRGEVVVLQAPPEIPIEGFSLLVRPPAAPDPGVSPKELWVATDAKLFHVTLPEDAWKQPGARYDVTLPAPTQTRCLALVIERAYADDRDAQVSLAEVGAFTALGAVAPEELVKKLDDPAVSEASSAVLRSGGAAAFAAVTAGFAALGEQGRRLALDVMDHAPCATSLPVFVAALVGEYPAQEEAARDRIRRCGAAGAEALAKSLDEASTADRPAIALELAVVAPEVAVRTLGARLEGASRKLRRAYRSALALAADSEASRAAYAALLGDERLGAVASLDLLRALGKRAAIVGKPVESAFGRLAARGDFRTRYLLVSIAANLEASLPSAAAYLRSALSTKADPHVRAEAARSVTRADAYRGELFAALADPEMRVREAAVQTFAATRAPFAGSALAERLSGDAWPTVRSAAAVALGQLGADRALDEALAVAIEDESPAVRRPVVLALGHRSAREQAPQVVEVLDDPGEDPSVRAAAALALGMMCHRPATDRLTKYAEKLSDIHADAAARAVGRSAVAALGILSPRDLRQRLAPLERKGVPGVYRAAARQALTTRKTCRPTGRVS